MSAVLDRIIFTTSRLLDFFSEKELTAQIGHSRDHWPVVVLKELVDNNELKLSLKQSGYSVQLGLTGYTTAISMYMEHAKSPGERQGTGFRLNSIPFASREPCEYASYSSLYPL